METTVVIPCINSEDVIVDCIKSLNSKYVPIIIVDNGSKDQTLNRIMSLKLNISIINAEKNLGWGNAANLGIENVKTKFALLLNPDVKFLSNNPIEVFEEKIKKYSNIGMASCLTLNKDLVQENGRITFFSKLNKKVLNNKNDIPECDTSSTINCVYGGAVIFFDINKFRSVKGFDKNCFLYLEEDDLCYRLKKNGHMNIIFPSIKAIHLGSHSSKIPNLTWWKNWHWVWSDFYFKKKYNFKNLRLIIFFKIILWFLKTSVYYFINKKKYYLYSGRLNGALSFFLGKKAMENTPLADKNNAKGLFGIIKTNINENYTLSK
tara:strand:- start:245 stop:1204 length:960 start_codon:yes stop_codon:yes gene_type:complete